MYDLNLLILVIILFVICLYNEGFNSIPNKLLFSRLSFYMGIFILYLFIRQYDFSNSFHLSLINNKYMFNDENFNFGEVTYTILQFSIFFLSAIIYYNNPRQPLWFWLLISGYMILFVLRNSIGFEELKSGYRLGAGYLIFSLIGFMFIKDLKNNFRKIIPFVVCITFILWNYFIGNRTPVLALIIFLVTMYFWPVIIKNKLMFFSFFWIVTGSIMASIFGYTYIIISNPTLAENINNFVITLTSRDFTSRFFVWSNVMTYIVDNPIFGHGTDMSSEWFAPKGYTEDMLRDQISSHSLYLELLLRLGIVGLLIYLSIFFSIWKIFWIGRKKRVVRIVGSYLIASLFFSALSQFWSFESYLQSGFAWGLLGIGIGASFSNVETIEKLY